MDHQYKYKIGLYSVKHKIYRAMLRMIHQNVLFCKLHEE